MIKAGRKLRTKKISDNGKMKGKIFKFFVRTNRF